MNPPITLTLPIAAAPLQRARETLALLLAGWRQRRDSRLTYLALSGLDARTLRDLGFDRSELLSIADLASPHSDRVRLLQGPRF